MTGINDGRTRGFTLVEILIVVVILAILAAIVIPQFTEASDQARANALIDDLRTIRSQIQLYTVQHRDTLPTNQLVNQLTRWSTISGATRTRPSATYRFGPYVQAFPKNPISGISTVRFRTLASQTFSPQAADGGWWYNTATGEFRANLRNIWLAEDGTRLNQK